MLEFEVKARVPDADALRRRLGPPRAVERHRDTYFQHPARDFAETDEALRLREQGDRVEVTYKGPKLDPGSKARLEHTSIVEDATALRRILESVGFHAAAEVRKTREVYRVDGFHVALDAVEGLGAFVEVERVLPEGADLTAARQRALELLSAWGLGDPIRESYLELLRQAEAATEPRDA